MTERTSDIIVVGAGIGGLTLALALHQAGIACRIYEAAAEMKPVGVGINVRGDAFPPALAAIATSVHLATGRLLDRAHLLTALLNALEPAYDTFITAGPADALARWRAHATLGARCRIERDGLVVEGTALDVDQEGALLVRDDQGALRRVLSGEIT